MKNRDAYKKICTHLHPHLCFQLHTFSFDFLVPFYLILQLINHLQSEVILLICYPYNISTKNHQSFSQTSKHKHAAAFVAKVTRGQQICKKRGFGNPIGSYFLWQIVRISSRRGRMFAQFLPIFISIKRLVKFFGWFLAWKISGNERGRQEGF